MDELDWPGWTLTERGWLKMPPRRCPACSRVWPTFGDRPRESFVRCACSAPFWHTLWTCPACGEVAAEGCVDVDRWQEHTTPVGTPPSRRWSVRARAAD